MSRKPRAAIVGGGIGGLAAALALHRRGYEFDVYEQGDEITEIGGGLNLSPNALKALRMLGVEEGKAPFAKPRQRRIYSNTGIELAALYLEEQSGIDIRTYFDEAVVQPLKLTNTSLRTSPAYGARSTALDLVTFGRELLVPRLVSDVTVALATSPYEPELKGVLPGFGRQNPNLWGLGFEIRGTKRPHWTGSLNSPRTFGHFGQSGSFVWVDPELDLTVSFVGNRRFDTWSIERWPPIADAIIGAMT